MDPNESVAVLNQSVYERRRRWRRQSDGAAESERAASERARKQQQGREKLVVVACTRTACHALHNAASLFARSPLFFLLLLGLPRRRPAEKDGGAVCASVCATTRLCAAAAAAVCACWSALAAFSWELPAGLILEKARIGQTTTARLHTHTHTHTARSVWRSARAVESAPFALISAPILAKAPILPASSAGRTVPDRRTIRPELAQSSQRCLGGGARAAAPEPVGETTRSRNRAREGLNFWSSPRGCCWLEAASCSLGRAHNSKHGAQCALLAAAFWRLLCRCASSRRRWALPPRAHTLGSANEQRTGGGRTRQTARLPLVVSVQL